MPQPLRDQTLALAGVFQAALLTQQLARTGRCERAALRANLESILRIDAPDTEAVVGGVDGVRLGLTFLRDKLTGQSAAPDMEVARYVVSVLAVANTLNRRADVQEGLRKGIESADHYKRLFATDETEGTTKLAEKLGEVYTLTLSTLTPRILVTGEQGHLQNTGVAAQVRAALLGGVRAAVLWRQLGGRRWHLLFRRRGFAQAAGELLA